MIKQPHKWRDAEDDSHEQLLKGCMFDSWSFSKVAGFTRNEKAFEMSNIYRIYGKSAASQVAGQAYHKALEFYFIALREGEILDMVTLEQIAYKHITDFKPNWWKLQKTTPTIEKCVEKALTVNSALLSNFLAEIAVYQNEIAEILAVEERIEEFLTVNGVDIPMECHLVLDLAFITHDGRVIIADHKSKKSFTDEKVLKFELGKQAITYVLGWEAKTGIQVDEYWVVENKYAKNKDGSSQVKPLKVEINVNTRKLYETQLYEPLKRMIEAVSNPDYVYLINESDNFVDKAELHEFWARTMIAEVEDFNIPEDKQDLMRKRQRKIRNSEVAMINPDIIHSYLNETAVFVQYDLTNKDMTREQKIIHRLTSFGIVTQIPHSFRGYSSDTFLMEVTAGTKIDSIRKFNGDIANALDVPSVRIMKDLHIHEGKSYLAIDASKEREADLIFDPSKLEGLKLPIGIDNFNRTIVWDLENHSTPHMLICGQTGSGKSVSIDVVIAYAIQAGINDIEIIDPKNEFKKYASVPGIKVFTGKENVELRLRQLVEIMEERVDSGVCDKKLVIFDEFANAVGQAKKGKELDIREEVQVGFYAPKKLKGMFGESMADPVPKMAIQKVGEYASLESNLGALLEKGRSLGIRVLAATQRASVNVIRGDIKVNLTVQVCFRVNKEVDSKVVLDEAGAENLMGKGDGLIKSPEYNGVVRFQAFYKK